MSLEIRAILAKGAVGSEIEVKGWVRTFRNNQFISLNDGSTIHNLQIVVDFNQTDETLLKRITTGAAISVSGVLKGSQGSGQKVELVAQKIVVLGDSDPEIRFNPKNIV